MFGIKQTPVKPDAISLLTKDHHDVDEMFKEYEEMKDRASTAVRKSLVAEICNALTIHAIVEEEIFYPAARGAQGVENDLVDEATLEHQTLKDIIGRLERAPVSDPLYDAAVKVLSEYTKRHVKEEETELFPEVRKSGVDLQQLGAQLQSRTNQLKAKGRARRTKQSAMARPRGPDTTSKKPRFVSA